MEEERHGQVEKREKMHHKGERWARREAGKQSKKWQRSRTSCFEAKRCLVKEQQRGGREAAEDRQQVEGCKEALDCVAARGISVPQLVESSQ